MKSVCIVRLSALGDVTHVLPTIHHIRSTWPDCEITWVIGKLEARLLAPIEGVEFVVFDKTRGLGAYRELRQQMRGRRFDALLHMQLSLRANAAAWMIPANMRIGYDRARARELHGLRLTHRIAADRGPHVVDVLAGFTEALGIGAAPPVWNVPITETDRDFARHHLAAAQPTALISPCSSHKLRNWSATRYASVSDRLVEAGWQVILVGGPSDYEHQMADEILGKAQTPALNLTGKDSLKQLLAMIDDADLLIAPDTGPTHFASALCTPVIGLYAATDPRRSGPYRYQSFCVDRYAEAALKFRGKPAGELNWGTKIEEPGVMDLIDVEAVWQQVIAASSEIS